MPTPHSNRNKMRLTCAVFASLAFAGSGAVHADRADDLWKSFSVAYERDQIPLALESLAAFREAKWRVLTEKEKGDIDEIINYCKKRLAAAQRLADEAAKEKAREDRNSDSDIIINEGRIDNGSDKPPIPKLSRRDTTAANLADRGVLVAPPIAPRTTTKSSSMSITITGPAKMSTGESATFTIKTPARSIIVLRSTEGGVFSSRATGFRVGEDSTARGITDESGSLTITWVAPELDATAEPVLIIRAEARTRTGSSASTSLPIAFTR